MYGVDDASFQAAGREEGILKLTREFYSQMASLEEGKRIFVMHPADIEVSIDKLFRFLCGWLGGPKLFHEKYGSIRLPQVHSHLEVKERERDAWLLCMEKALESQPYADDFKSYLLEQLMVPAERIRQVCSSQSIPN